MNITQEDKARLEHIIQCMKHDVNKADMGDETILIKSSKENNAQIVKLLFTSNFLDVNKGTKEGVTALHIASTREHFNIIKLLLSHPLLDPNQVNNNYMTVLMEASRDNKYEVVELLLRHPKIDVNKVNLNKKSALIFACELRRTKIVRLLLKCPATETDLHDENNKIAADYIQNHTSKNDFDDLAKLTNTGHTCCSEYMKIGLQISARNGHLQMTQALMNCYGMDLNNGYGLDGTPLYIASRENKADIVNTLLSNSDIDVNKKVDGKNPLLYAKLSI